VTGLSVVLPAFDDTARLRERISELHGTLSQRFDPIEYVVVDDAGATDLDSLRSVAPDVRLFENRANLGKGASTYIGLHASKHPKILFTDADVPFDMASYDRVAESLAADAPLTIGCRRRSDSQILVGFDALRYAAQRHVIGLSVNHVVRLLTRLTHTDTQCGLKAFDRATAVDLFRHVAESGFLFDIELLIAAREKDVRVVEVPVCVIYESSETTLRWGTDALRTSRALFRIRRNLQRGMYRNAPASAALEPAREHSVELPG
jgi:glycosyltransferase involved in cell wall biosynthesis